MRGKLGRTALGLAAAAMLATAAAARADVYDDNPAAASRGQGDEWVFARRTADGAMLERHWTASGWTPWQSLGGVATSGPAATAYGPGIYVFARGVDGAIYQDTLLNGAWTGWSSLGGYSTSAPAAIARRGTNYLDVAMKGGDNTIWLKTYVPGAGWSSWSSLGGNLTGGPALDSHSDGILDVFARGTNGEVYQQAWTGTQWWDSWADDHGGILGAPAAVNKQPHDLDLYGRGAGNALYQNHWDSINSWSGWQLVDSTPMGSSPAVLSDSAGHEVVFARNGDEMYVKEWRNPGGWTRWADFGPIAVPPPPPPAPPPPPSLPDGEVRLTAGIRCTPPGGRLRVSITVRRPRGRKRAHVRKIVFFTKGRGARKRVDRRAPFVVRLRISRPAGSKGRVYARVYYTRGRSHRQHRKTVSRIYRVCA